MRRATQLGVVAAVVTGIVGLGAFRPVPADQPASCPPAQDSAPPNNVWNGSDPWCYGWEGAWQQATVSVPSPADGTTLAGTEFAPTTLATASRLPAVAILHGLGGKQQSVWYLARYLASQGYIALTVTTAGNSAANFDNAMEAMLDFLRSGSAPYAPYTDTAELGAVGHSAGARAASWVQDVDTTLHPTEHVQAVVALDNLTSDQQGDSGTYLLAPQCTLSQVSEAFGRGPVYTSGLNSEPITPRVPAMGLASDDNAVTCPERNVPLDSDPAAKEAAWSKWRAAGLASMELVLQGTNHLSYDQDASRTVTGDAHLQLISELTKAWFDRYLLGASSGLDDLLGSTLFGAGRDSLLSTQFHSGAYVPERGVDCADFTLESCPAT